jgi:hypothetical protein
MWPAVPIPRQGGALDVLEMEATALMLDRLGQGARVDEAVDGVRSQTPTRAPAHAVTPTAIRKAKPSPSEAPRAHHNAPARHGAGVIGDCCTIR